MSLFSKFFGKKKLELENSVDDVLLNDQKQEQKNQNKDQSHNPSPFLVDVEKNIKTN